MRGDPALPAGGLKPAAAWFPRSVPAPGPCSSPARKPETGNQPFTRDVMNRKFSLKYGKGEVSFEIPADRLLYELAGRNRPAIGDLRAAYLRALDDPVDSAPLREVVRPGDRVVITVSDITRGWQKNADTLPLLLDYLNASGVNDEKVTVIIAVGAHRKNTPVEFVELCSRQVCHRVRVVNHDAWDRDNMVHVGRTRRGTPVEVNRLAVEADKLITTGGVVYHYMVGYGGGRKSIMPGICSNTTIQACHLFSLEPEIGAGRSRLAQSKMTDGNPAHEDMMECAALAKPDFMVNVVPNLDGEICGIFAGNWASAWRKATRLVDEMYGVAIGEKADIVIASAGGYPRDINLYQTTKTMDNAVQAVVPGGVSVILSECPDIREPMEYFKWFDHPTIEAHDRALRAKYTIAGWCALITREYCRTSPTVMLTRPENADLARRAGLVPAAGIAEALDAAYRLCGRQKPSITVMPQGANTLPFLTP
jgi:nickel-dependent lactate racemase